MSERGPTGVSTIVAVCRHEIRTWFVTPVGWLFLVTGLGAGAALLHLSLAATGEASLRGWVPNFVVTLLFCVPWLTMRTVAGERRRGTLDQLLAAPVPLWAVLVGKWLAVLTVCVALIALCAPYVVVLAWVGDPDPGVLVTTLLGLGLCCALFAAVGVCVSALAPEPTVAAVGTVAVLLPTWLAGVAEAMAPVASRSFLSWWSLIGHLRSFGRGVLDSGDVAWFVGLTGLFLFWGWRALESLRWR